MSFLLSLLLPVLATVLLFRAYPDRAARGEVSRELTTTSALARGAVTGASALVFLGVAGIAVLVYRGRALTPAGTGVPAAVFWATQFLVAAAIGAVIGALTALALLARVRERLARLAPAASPPAE